MGKKQFGVVTLLLLSCICISSCGATPTQTSTATPAQSPTALPMTATATISPTETMILVPTDTANCPSINNQITMSEAKTKDAASQEILDYLDQGGDPEKLSYQN